MSDECKIDEYSSAACSRGTKGCEVEHASELPAQPGSTQWLVRDLTGAEPSVSCETKAQAEAWVRHLREWKPNSRPVIEPNVGDKRLPADNQTI